MKRRLLPVLVVCLLAGCSKIHEQRSFELDPADHYSLIVSAPVSEQKIRVVATSDQPINVFVILEKDVPSAKKTTEFDPSTLTSGVVASQMNTKEASLDATIPAKEEFRVYLNGA